MRTAMVLSLLTCSVVLSLGMKADAQETPHCNVDLNYQTLLTWPVPQSAYTMQVVPAIRTIARVHSMALTAYSIPFETFWQLTGLNLLFPNPPGACCPLCPNAPCSPDVKFTKPLNAADPSYAAFTWRPKAGLTFKNTVNEIQGTLVIAGLDGRASVSGSAIILQFTEGLPVLTLVDLNYMQTGNKTTTFDGKIACIGSLSQWGVMRQLQPGTQIPKLDLFVSPQ